MTIKSLNLIRPSNGSIRPYIEEFTNSSRYYLADSAIVNLVHHFPENKKLEDILLKISVINDLYSTQIYSTFSMARHIRGIDIDAKLQQGDPDAVGMISSGHGICSKRTKKEISFYSFSTKYCSWHNKDAYPIYDSFVHKILMAYQKSDHFSEFGESDLKDYRRFKEIITDFVNHYSLTDYDLKEIDKFLWVYGKRIFRNNFDAT